MDLIAVDHLAVEAVVDMDQDLEDVDHLAVAPLATVDLWLRFLVLVAGQGGGGRRTAGQEQGAKQLQKQEEKPMIIFLTYTGFLQLYKPSLNLYKFIYLFVTA